MKDIDFDELDRAVSSVLGQTVPNKEQTAGATELSPPTAAAASAPSSDTTAEKVVAPVVTPPPATRKAPSSTSGLAVKRRGRFMDVMHPSATMVPTAAANTKPALTEHASSQLQPLSPDLKESSAPQAEVVETLPVVTTAVPAEPIAELDESQALIGAEPAPAENPVEIETKPADSPEHTATPSTDTKTKDGAPSASLDNVVDATEPEAVTDTSSPQGLAASVSQETPFLTDTKVDKRPLGGFGAATADTDTAESQDTQTAPTVTLPRELQSDVVEVESLQDDSTAPAEDTPLFATSVSAAPEQDDGRVEGHPLFDTSTYHEPIAAAHEGSVPVWLKWVLGLAICLGLGAGVGYFLFTAGL